MSPSFIFEDIVKHIIFLSRILNTKRFQQVKKFFSITLIDECRRTSPFESLIMFVILFVFGDGIEIGFAICELKCSNGDCVGKIKPYFSKLMNSSEEKKEKKIVSFEILLNPLENIRNRFEFWLFDRVTLSYRIHRRSICSHLRDWDTIEYDESVDGSDCLINRMNERDHQRRLDIRKIQWRFHWEGLQISSCVVWKIFSSIER